MKKIIFFAIASAILLFSIIVVNISPAINGLISGQSWSQQACSYHSDRYDDEKKKTYSDQKVKRRNFRWNKKRLK